MDDPTNYMASYLKASIVLINQIWSNPGPLNP